MTAPRRIYWRPRGVSRTALVLIAVLSLVSMTAVEYYRVKKQQPYYKEKMSASRLARKAMDALKVAREKQKIAIDRDADPALTGLIGALITPTTSNSGSLAAKQISVNPNFAAVLVQMLKKIGLRTGDVVAVGCSGSFPAMNVCTYAAIKTLGLRPIIISSTAASQWGANYPDFLWIDMERILYEQNIFRFRSAAASVGGVEDRGLGLSPDGRKMILAAIERNKLPFLDPKNYADSIDQRMNLYRERAGDAPIKAYISVGGGTTSVGKKLGKRLFRPGLNFREPTEAMPADSVMSHFIDQGIPAIHLVKIAKLAQQFGLPAEPSTTIPVVGQGEIFRREEYNVKLTIAALVVIVLALFTFLRLDWGFRLLTFAAPPKKSEGRPEPMI